MKKPRFLRLGLTGGIASGKSTASRFFAELGAGVIDADQVAREAVAPGSEGLREIREAFGPGVLNEDGSLDRDAMRALVFADPDARTKLEGIVHPIVYLGVMNALMEFEEQGRPAGVVEAALLLENPAPFQFDALVVVICGAARQAERLRVAKGWPEPEIEGVLQAQMTDDQRVESADHVLRNESDEAALRGEVVALWERLGLPPVETAPVF